MYLRRCYRQKDGKRHGYWALVESYRTSRGPRQRVVAYLGEMDAAGGLGLQQQAAGPAAVAQSRLFGDVEPQQLALPTKIGTRKIAVAEQLRRQVPLVDLDDWLARYRTAWKSDDPDQIAALFVDEATYSPWPFSSAWAGRPQIVRKWIERGDSTRPWEFEHEILAFEGDTGVVRGLTTYPAHGDEPALLSPSQRAQQHRVDDAEDGGGRADAQRQRRHRGGSEAGRAQQPAEAKPEIAQQGIHGLTPPAKRPSDRCARRAGRGRRLRRLQPR